MGQGMGEGLPLPPCLVDVIDPALFAPLAIWFDLPNLLWICFRSLVALQAHCVLACSFPLLEST